MMTRQILWTKPVLETFIKEGNLNKRQEYIMRTRAKGYSIVKQAQELNLSVDQVNKEVATLKKLYDATQINSNILPKRCKNKKDLLKNK